MSYFLLIGNHPNEFENFEHYFDAQFDSLELDFYSDKEKIFDAIYAKQPDIILLQYSYDNNKGPDFCHLLKNKSASRYIPILLIGESLSTSNERIKAMQSGADAFITKPIDKAELQAIINMLFRVKNAEDSLRKSNEELKQQVQKASDELISKEKRYSYMFDAAGNIIILIDKNRKILEWNTAAAQILEISKTDALGKDFEEIITNKVMRADINDRINDKIDTQNQGEYQVNIRTNTDQKYQILWTVSHLKDNKDQFQYILLIGQNVSQRVKDERERKKSEAILRSNYLFLNTLMNSLPSLIYYKNTNGQYLGCNLNFADYCGIPPEEIVGKYTQDLNPESELEIIIAEDKIVFETGQKQVKQITKRHSDGKTHHFIINKTAFYNPDKTIGGLVGVMVDITKIKEMESALQESEMFFKGITDSANDAIIITDKNNKIQFWNKAAELLFGYRRDEIINKNIYQTIIPLEEASKLENHLQIIINNKEKPAVTNSLEINTISKDGQLFPAEFSNSTILLNKKQSVIYIAKNIGIRKQAENMLRVAKEKAEEADRLKTAFLSNMSHEIRTPMNAIVGFSQLLANNTLSEEKRHLFIDQININSESLLNLIEDIIYVSKIESGKIDIKIDTCHLNSVLDEIHTSFLEHRRRMAKEDVEIILTKGIDNPNFSFLSDNQRLRQILTNLIGNALKFTDKGSVTFGYEVNDNEKLLFYVKDTGLGINPEKVNYIFDRFTKIAANKTKLYGGTGLGLSITKHLVEELGGRIWVESEADKGSTFYFLLPYQGLSQQQEHIGISKAKPEKMNLKNARILIAEDEYMNYLFLQEALGPTGAKLTWAKNGQEALTYIENNQEFDLILMDMKMPIMDGYDATKKIKSLKPKITIIAQTAYAMPEEQKKGFQAGCDFYLSKPIDPLVLIDTLKKHLPYE
jgi:PAS domain S-box-containing protein